MQVSDGFDGRKPVVRFADCTINLQTAELLCNGNKTTLQDQPFQILTALLESPGQLVTREELVRKLWPSGTYVDFDQSLNKAIARLREALGDNADHPRFVETLPRRGYRWIAVAGFSELTPAGPEPSSQGMLREAQPKTPAPRPEGNPQVHGYTVAIAGTVFALAGWNRLWIRAKVSSSLAQIRSLAVLSLDNLSGDWSEDYLADGMTEALITEMGKVCHLRVYRGNPSCGTRTVRNLWKRSQRN